VNRVVRVRALGQVRWGVVREGAVLELPDGPWGESPRVGSELGSLDELELLAPTAPTKIIGVGRNYVAHAAEHGVDVPEAPLLFMKPPSSVIGPGGEIVVPALSERVEHEGELAVVIGSRCRAVAESKAWGHVLGISCGNDVTARDIQRADSQWTRGKGFDTFCPIGPWVVTGLAEAGAAELEVQCRVNGEVRQRGRTSQMVFPPASLISYISRVMTLEPGDVILTGTPAGVGPLAPGDVVEVEVEGVGTLSNPVT
jgi:2-keto-4-pentenoate hydratase/2-oxohepta-3-ene-1,7-dioic acid hydratase in catechol pathway